MSGGITAAGSGGSATGGAAIGGALTGGMGSGGEDPCGLLVDDMENGTGHVCLGSGRMGVWYAFNDGYSGAEQWPAPTTPGIPIEVSEIPGGRDGSLRAIHTFGQGFWSWGAGVGLDLSFDGVTYGLYDASRYGGVTFWARSDLGSVVRIRISTEATTSVAYGGTCGNLADSSVSSGSNDWSSAKTRFVS